MDIENTIKVLLNGCVKHSDIEEIKSKLKKINSDNRPLIIKLGLDPSAPDIHIGHAVVLRKIRQLQELGHEAIVIIGDFTGMIGDPTGKAKTRKQLSRQEIEANAETYKSQIFKIIDKNKTTVKFNSEWLDKLSLKDVISLASKCTVAKMLEREDFKKRYINHQSISIHEFFYPLLQAYDSVATKADIEFGGTDQIFNVLMGRNIQRYFGQEPQLTFFLPLLEGTDGIEKMSKSLGNYVGISEEPPSIYTKIMKIPDNMIIKYYELCTDVHPDKISEIKKELKAKNPRDVKMSLAKEITTLYCGKDNAEDAEKYFKSVFWKQETPNNATKIKIPKNSSNFIFDFINVITETGDFKSKSEIKRLFEQRSVKINGSVITEIQSISELHGEATLQIGKSHIYKLYK